MKKSEVRKMIREEMQKLNEARTIGVKYKNMIKKLVAQARKKGLMGRIEVKDFVTNKLPQDAWDKWEGAYDEIERLIHDANMKTESKNPQKLDEKRYPPKAIDYNKVKDPDRFWSWTINNVNSSTGLSWGRQSEIGDIIMWLNMAVARWNAFEADKGKK